MTINPTQLKNWLVFVLGLASAGYAAYLTATSSTAHATPAAIAAAVLLGVERYVSDPSTGNTPTSTPAATFPPKS